jgi:hypothetical protein
VTFVSNIEEQLCIVFMDTGNLYHLHDLEWFKNIYIWSAFVFRLTLTPLFIATHAFLISLSPFFSRSVIGVVRVSSAVSDYD